MAMWIPGGTVIVRSAQSRAPYHVDFLYSLLGYDMIIILITHDSPI